jgi:hypothetical protein
MRNIPVDTTQITLLASGKLMPKPLYAVLADGSRKRVPDKQAEEEGIPLWVVDCYLDDDEEEGRAEVVGVTVGSFEKPAVKKFQPVQFEGLVARAYVRDGRVAFSFSADRIATAPAAKAA